MKTLSKLPGPVPVKNISALKGRLLGKGGFNIVFKAKGIPNKDLVIRQTIRRLGFMEKREFLKELKLTLELSKVDIGPKIYLAGFDQKGRGIIVMKKYQADLSTLLTPGRNISQTKLENALIRIFRKLAQRGTYCTDLKLNNIVGTWKNNVLDIRLIDFDTYFCKQNKVKSSVPNLMAMLLILSATVDVIDSDILKKNNYSKLFKNRFIKYKNLNKSFKIVNANGLSVINRYRKKNGYQVLTSSSQTI